ncbi:MAG: RNA methyltransferase [Bacteroidetes bacterium]|nr:RNA methyltransferase [Fibrella sp.]
MVSKNLSKSIQLLHQKKQRQAEGAFLVEGAKSVQEVLASDFRVDVLVMTEGFYKENPTLPDHQRPRLEIATADELTRIGTLESNNAALAVVRTKENQPLVAEAREFVLVLDDIRDPGNLGTILRIADWYGIRKILCSNTTADIYNPKVIAASKGSFTRVQWWYGDLVDLFGTYQPGIQALGQSVYGAFLDGDDVHTTAFGPAGGYVVMGNESNGIRAELAPFVDQRITIPRYGAAESLNVGIATAVILDNIRAPRRQA